MLCNDKVIAPDSYYDANRSELGLSADTILALMVQQDYSKTWVAHNPDSANNPQNFKLSRGSNRLDATAQQDPDLTLDTGANAKSFTVNKNPTHLQSLCHIGQKTNGGVGVMLVSETIPNLVLINMDTGALTDLLDPLPQVDGAAAKADDYSHVNYNSATKELSLIQNKKKRVIKFKVNFANGDVSGITLQGTDANPTMTLDVKDVNSSETTSPSGYQRYAGAAVFSEENRYFYGAYGNKAFKVREYAQGHGTPVVFVRENEQSILDKSSRIDVVANHLYKDGANAGYVATRLEFEMLGEIPVNTIQDIGFDFDFARLDDTSGKADWTKWLDTYVYHDTHWARFNNLPTVEGNDITVRMTDDEWNALTQYNKCTMVQPDINQLNPPDRALVSNFSPTRRDDAYYTEFAIIVKNGRLVKLVFAVSQTTSNWSRIQFLIPHLSDVKVRYS